MEIASLFSCHEFNLQQSMCDMISEEMEMEQRQSEETYYDPTY